MASLTSELPGQFPPPAGPLSKSRIVTYAAVVWMAVVLVSFFPIRLPNNPSIVRWEIWLIVPELLDFVDPPDAASGGGAEAMHSGWKFLPQRLDLLAVMAVVLGGAWGAGQLLLRPLRLPLASNSAERTVFAFAVGLSAVSLATLAAGLAGELSRPPLGTALGLCFAVELLLRLVGYFAGRPGSCVDATPPAPPYEEGEKTSPKSAIRPVGNWTGPQSAIPVLAPLTRGHWLVLAALTPFLMAMLFASLLPSTDFDVNEYHFQGPKEFFQVGRIGFLEHNVYTSFPFGTEMLTLLAMVLRDDWYRGALAGKGVLMFFGPLTGLALFAAGRRWFGTTAGVMAAVLYLITPWIFRISTIAYAEGGLCFYLFTALLALGIAAEQIAREDSRIGLMSGHFLLAGLLAGGAMACKYPGLVSVVLPLLAATMWLAVQRRGHALWILPGAFLLGTALTVGPWLLKNFVETGNPVYPLAHSIFDGRDWDPILDVRWQKAHSPSTYDLTSLVDLALDIALRNDWVNPLLFAFAPLALLARAARRRAAWIWLYVGWLTLSCWLFTHRIDRFWVPLLPVAALLAGSGAAWWHAALKHGLTGFVPARRMVSFGGSWLMKLDRLAGFGLTVLPFAGIGLFNLEFIAGPRGLCGYNDFLRDLDEAGLAVVRITSPEMAWMNRNLPPGSKVLSVGDAAVFEARFPVVYNTVFDRSIFQDWFKAQPGEASDGAELREAEVIRRKLAEERITHIYVSWREILRYRSPGNYGYTYFITPERFGALRRLRILQTPLAIPQSVRELDRLDQTQRAELERWGSALVTQTDQQPRYVTFQVFPVAAPGYKSSAP